MIFVNCKAKTLDTLKKIFAFAALFFVLLSPAGDVSAANAWNIRQEINITDGYFAAQANSVATSSAVILFDSTKYSGTPTFYFEAVASTSASFTNTITLRRRDTGTDDCTINIPTSTTAYTLIRSSACTLPAGQTEYVVRISSASGGTTGVKAVRLLALQSFADTANNAATSTETQIEIGNEETYSNTATSTFASPKYWTYNSSAWDGTQTVYAEVTYKTIQAVASSTSYNTAGTFTVNVPTGTASTSVQLWGGGGAGGGSKKNPTQPDGGAGGAGGQYASSTLTNRGGTANTLVVAASQAGTSASAGSNGNDSTWNSTVVVAKGGTGGAVGSGATVASTTGSSTGCVGDTCFAGGSSGNGTTIWGGGGGGGAGTGGAGGSATGAAVAGSGTAVGGGAGGAKITASGTGSSATTAGGGGGGALSLANADQVGGTGAQGQALVVDYIATTTIAVQEDNGSFGSWTDKAYIVVGGGAATSTRVRSSSFSPTNGRHYRIAFRVGDSRDVVAIYNAKIVVDQSVSFTKLEPQYLLANTKFASGTSLQNFLTKWDSTEWTGATNTYLFDVDAANSSASVATLNTSGGTLVTNSTVTSPNNEATSTTGMTMPSNGNLDVKATTNNGDVYGARILVQATQTISTVTISGTLYGTDEATAITTTPNVKMSINGAAPTTVAANGSGVFSFSGITAPNPGDIITIWISGATEKGTLVFRYGSSCTGYTSCTGLSIYRNETIVSSYDGSAITNANLAGCTDTLGSGCATSDLGFDVSSGNLTLDSGRTLRIKDSATFAPGGNVTADTFNQSAGTFTGGTGSITFNGDYTLSGGTFTSTSGTLAVNGNWTHTAGGTFNHNNGTVTHNSNSVTWDVNTTETFYNLTLGTGGGAFTIASGDTFIVLNTFDDNMYNIDTGSIEARGNIIADACNFGDATINMLVAGNQTITTNGGNLPNLNINKPSGSVTVVSGTSSNLGVQSFALGATSIFTAPSGTFDVDGAWTDTAGGTFNHNNGTVFHDRTTVTWDFNGTETFYNFISNNDGGGALTIGTGDTLLVLNDYTDGQYDVNGGTIEVRGNVNITSNTTGFHTPINLTGSNAQTITDNGVAFSSLVTINKTNSTDTVTLATDSNFAGGLTLTKGTFNQSTYNLTGGGAFSQSGGTFNGGSGSITLGSFTLSGGTFNSTSGNLNLGDDFGNAGNWTHTAGGTFNNNSGTVRWLGPDTNAATWDVNSSETFNNLEIDCRAGGFCGQTSDITIGTGDTLIVTGTFTQTNGSFGGGTIEARGNVVVGSTADGGTGTLSFLVAGDQTITGNGGETANLNVSKASGTLSAGSTDLRVVSFSITSGTFTSTSGTLTVGGNDYGGTWSDTGGTFNNNGGTVIIGALDQTNNFVIPSTETFNNFELYCRFGQTCTGSTSINLSAGHTIIVNGDFTNLNGGISGGALQVGGNVTIGASADGGTTPITLTGSNAQTITDSGGTMSSGVFTINKTNTTDTVTLASGVTFGGALTITKGIFDQGASYSATTTGALTVSTNGTWKNLGTGDIALGGDVSNSGTITLDGSGAGCGGSDAIVITSTSPGTQRTWSGSGTFSIIDVNATDQAGSITAYSSTNTSNNGWTFNAGCPGITISGTVYSDEGSTALTTTPTIRIKINGSGSYSASANGSGQYSISSVSVGSGDVITAYLDGATEKAAAVTRAVDSSSNISNLDLYQNHLIVRHEDSGPITNTNLSEYDSSDDSDIPFTVSGSSLTLASGDTLYVWNGKTFSPGGNVTTTNLKVSGTYDNSTSNPSLTVLGDLTVSSTGTFTKGTATTTFNGGTTQTITDSTSSQNLGKISVLLNGTNLHGYSYAHPITIDHTKVPNTDQTNFPVLISGLYDGNSASVWTAGNVAEGNAWQGITYGNGVFVAVAGSGTHEVMTSPDGITWTAQTQSASEDWISVTYGNGLFVAVSDSGSHQVMTSPDGVTWTNRTAAEANGWISVTYGNGEFVAVAYSGTHRVMTSPDGVTWTTQTAAEANSWNAVTYGNGLFVAVSVDGTHRVMTSPDGVTWTAQTQAETNTWNGITYGNGLFVALSVDGTHEVMTSPDGVTWTARTAAENNSWGPVAYGNGEFVAVTGTGTHLVMTSPDGITWTARSGLEKTTWLAMTYGNGLFVAIPIFTSHSMVSSESAPDLRTTGNGGHVQNSSGYDVNFYSDSSCSTKLDWETEKYTAATGEVDYWVKIPTLSHTTDTTFYLCYGNSSISTDQSNKTAVWDSNYRGVYHLGDGTTLSGNDSTSNANNLSASGSPTATTGQIDGAGNFVAASSQYLSTVSLSNGPLIQGPLTMEIWVNTADPTNRHMAMSLVKDDTGSANNSIDLETNSGNTTLFGPTKWGAATITNVALTASTWTSFVYTVDGSGNSILYKNGAVAHTSSTAPDSGTATVLRIASFNGAFPNPYWDGQLDEARVSASVRSADWIATEYNNQSGTLVFGASPFYTVGANIGSNGYTYSRPITIDHTKVPNTDQTDFPVLVSLTNPSLKTVSNGGKVQNSSGYDIIFTKDAAGNIPLDFETEKYVSTTGEIEDWVKIPNLSHTTDTTIYMWYGNSSISTDQSNKTAVWDSNYKTVWHFPNGSSLTANDSTLNNKNGSISGVTAGAGQIDGAAVFNGSASISSDLSSFGSLSSGTFSMWVKRTQTSTYEMLAEGDISAPSFEGDNPLQFWVANSCEADLPTFAAGGWHYLSGTWDGTHIKAYLDGALSQTQNCAPADTPNTLTVGHGVGTNSNLGFTGSIDELHLSSSARSADWIATEYNNESATSTFYSVGSESSHGTPSTVNLGSDVSVDDLSIDSSQTVSANGSHTLTFLGSGSGVFTVNGTFTPSSGTVVFSPTSPASTTIPAITYNNLTTSFGGTPSSNTSGYSYHRALTIDHTKVPNTDQTNFPILVSLTNPSLKTIGNGGKVQNTSGYDIIFTSDAAGNVPLDFETEKYVSTTGEIEDWVKIPTLSHTTDTTIYMWYGNSSVSTDESNKTAVWDNNYKGVWHLPDGSSLSANDSTSNGNNGTVNTVSATSGQIDGAASFPGTDEISFSSPVTSGLNTRTVSAWIKTTSTTREGILGTRSSGGFGFVVNRTTPGNLTYYHGGGATAEFAGGISTNTWYYVTAVDNAGTVTLYVNGASIGSQGGFSADTSPANFTIGDEGPGFGSYFNGKIDEARVSNVARSADWISTEYNNQSATSTFYTLGSEVGPVPYIYRRSITIDHTKVQNTDQSNFPVLVSLTNSSLMATSSGGKIQNTNGYDIVFASDSGCSSLLSWEVEKYVGTTGELEAWVKIPTLSHTSDTTIYMCYDNSSVTADESNKTGVWDPNYKGVWHLPDGSSLNLNDSTSNSNNGTNSGATATSGQIDGALAGNGSSQFAYVGDSSNTSIEPSSALTLSAWVHSSSANPNDIGAIGHWNDNANGYMLFLNGGKVYAYVNGTFIQSSATPYSSAATHFLTETWDGSTITLYIDGVSAGTATQNSVTYNSRSSDRLEFGHYSVSSSYINGWIDEGRLSNVARSADWITTEYNNESATSTFYTLGSESSIVAYTYSKSITIDHTKVPNTDQSNFPVLVSLTDPALKTAGNGGHIQNSSGYDIIFASDAACSSPLNFETEKYVSTTGEIEDWVKIPTLSHTSDTSIYMCYGNSSVTTDQSNKTGVWDSNYKGVWHLPDGTTLNVNDSTSNGSNGTNHSATAANGKIDGGTGVSSASGYIDFGAPSSLSLTTSAVTVEGWVKGSTGDHYGRIFAKPYPAGSEISYGILRVGDDPSTTVMGSIVTSDGQFNQQTSAPALDGSWHFVDEVYDGSNLTMYVDGSQSGQSAVTGGAILENGGTSLDAGYDTNSAQGITGTLDELRVSNIARSADWIATEYNNQSATSTFYTVGSETTPGGNFTLSPGTVTVGGNLTLSNSTVDANTNDPTLDVNGNVAINSGGVFSASNSGTFTIAGNFTNSGTFTHNSGTVTFDTTGTSLISGATTFNNFTSTTGGKTIEFQKATSGSPIFTIAGNFTLAGALGNMLSVLSDTNGSQWILHLSGTGSVSYVNVKDSGCDVGSSTIGTGNSLNQGNNGVCWRFSSYGGPGATEGGSGGGTPVSGGGEGGGSSDTLGGSGSSNPNLPETFTDTDGTALTTHNSNWTLLNGNFAIQSNQIKSNTHNVNTLAQWTGGSFTNDQYAEMTLSSLNAFDLIGVAVRTQNGAFSGYSVYTRNNITEIILWNNGNPTTLYTGNNFSQGDVMRLEIAGNTLTLKKNGTVVTTVTDSTFSSGRPGLSGFSDNGFSLGDNWTAGNLVQSGGGQGGGGGGSI